MSEKHLGTGSVEPPRVEGLLRLYSMKYCPFAERPRLVLNAKGIKHDIVNINLLDKPEWYFKLHPQGKVPTLLDGDKIIIESLDICDYLDEKYPENSLYSTDPERKAKEKELIRELGGAISVYARSIHKSEEKTPEEWWQEILKTLQVYEDELSKRGTAYFGGDKPGMLDYMLWPFAERADVLCLKIGAQLPIKEGDIPLMRKWKKSMRHYPVCAEIYTTPDHLWKLLQLQTKKELKNYDD